MPENFSFLGVGSLKKQKNFRNLLNAFNLLDEEILKYSQLIILEKDQKEMISGHAVHEHNLEDRVSLLGFKSDPYPWFNGTSVFVLSSSWEDLEMLCRGNGMSFTNCIN